MNVQGDGRNAINAAASDKREIENYMRRKLILSCSIAAVLAGLLKLSFPISSVSAAQREIGSRKAQILTQNGLKFRDLNKNGILDPYEDWRLRAQLRPLMQPVPLRETRRQ